MNVDGPIIYFFCGMTILGIGLTRTSHGWIVSTYCILKEIEETIYHHRGIMFCEDSH